MQMTIDEINTRFTVIEKEWMNSSADTRSHYLTELSRMSGDLATVTGAHADSARWLTRRISRVARHIDSSTG